MHRIRKIIFLLPAIICMVAVVAGIQGNIPNLDFPELPKLNKVVKGDDTTGEKVENEGSKNKRASNEEKTVTAPDSDTIIEKLTFTDAEKYASQKIIQH